jgi:hypothetical protein
MDTRSSSLPIGLSEEITQRFGNTGTRGDLENDFLFDEMILFVEVIFPMEIPSLKNQMQPSLVAIPHLLIGDFREIYPACIALFASGTYFP